MKQKIEGIVTVSLKTRPVDVLILLAKKLKLIETVEKLRVVKKSTGETCEYFVSILGSPKVVKALEKWSDLVVDEANKVTWNLDIDSVTGKILDFSKK